MKKRIGVVLVLLGCLFSFSACGSDETTTSASETTTAVTSSETQSNPEKASSTSVPEKKGSEQVIVKEIVIDENQPTSSGENVISQEIVV